MHLKVDTGMSRLGFEYSKFVQQFEKIKSFENILIEGIYKKTEKIKQEFLKSEEIRKYDELSVATSNEVKFRQELDRVINLKNSFD